jgi:hypothetical protein
MLVFTIIMISPLGRIIEKGINLHFISINNRVHKNEVTAFDKLESKLLYEGMIVAGKFLYPEGSEILNHYINGDGSDLHIDPRYIQSSPVVVNHLQKMKIGETKLIRFTQKDDWRLSYALNPFRLKKERGKALIWQEIEFLKKKDVYTELNFGIFKLKLQDGLIHALKPKKFVAKSEWVYESSN